MDLRETYNKIAEEWHKDHQDDSWWVEGTEKLISFLPPGATVLDAGCGGGTKTKYLAEKGFKVTGIDFAENLIAIARREAPQAQFVVMNMRDAASLPQSFDAVFAQASLLHIPKKEISDVLTSLASRLEPSGYFYIAVKGKRPDGPDEEMKEEHDYGYPYERFFSYYTLEELIGHLQKLGLTVVYQDIQKTGKSDWIQLIAQKH